MAKVNACSQEHWQMDGMNDLTQMTLSTTLVEDRQKNE